MKRYSRTSSSKFQNRYSEEFKRFLCNEFLTGTATRKSIEKKYNIGNNQLTVWLKKNGYDYTKPRIVPLPPMSDQPENLPDKDEASLPQLKKELTEARLLAETYRKMIEVAENEFKIRIVKKSNTK
ncbi:hypothetical protein [Hyunsoonleella rubra]|uniref:Transposase n=1 Tax=Hyunsoonleella rubra TaxID=1737062 RepID=A0ABW5TDX3_9FLAO